MKPFHFLANFQRGLASPTIAATLSLGMALCCSQTSTGQDWTQFRGPGGRSVSPTSIPTKFTETENVAWKKELPAKGASSPIVVGGKVIVTCSGGDNQEQLYTIAFDAQSGERLWTQKLWATGRTLCHPLSANAAPTPTSDGKHVYSFFSSNDLACMDLSGNLVWYRALGLDHPKAGNDVGMSSSPVVGDGVVVAQSEGQGDAFVVGLNAETGETLWEVEREKTASWATPLLIQAEGKPSMVVVQSGKKFSVLNLKTGATLFEEEGSPSTISSAAVQDGKLFLPIDGTSVYGILEDGTLEKISTSSQVSPRSMSTVVYGDQLFTINGAGVLNSFSAFDGTPGKKCRVGGSGDYWATPVIADKHMYFFTQEGVARVVDIEAMKVVHKHEFKDEVFLGSPALSEDGLFIRSNRYLWKIADSDG